MKTFILALLTLILINPIFSQETKSESSDNIYNIFDCSTSKNKFFVATNSGVSATPIGFRLGFLCKTGAYLGARIGKGEVYNMGTDQSTTKTTLFSITAGLIKPIYINDKFSTFVFLGGGYGQWWDYRHDSWTKDGYEIEGGIMLSYKKLMLNMSANVLNGYQTYATWDFTIGIGYRF